MNLSNIPKPLMYSISIVLLSIGFGITFQLVNGSILSYEGPLGAITVGSGEEQTTFEQFLIESEKALRGANATISEQELSIEKLRSSLTYYKDEVASLKELIEQLEIPRSDTNGESLNSKINVKVDEITKITAEEERISPRISDIKAAQQRLETQAKLTREFSSMILKK